MSDTKESLQKLISFLKQHAGEDDMASLRINSGGHILYLHGVQHEEYLTLDELVTVVDGGPLPNETRKTPPTLERV
jgi:hypothetical protein